MSKRPIDADARERIISLVGECALVEAGAGTGKTTLLVARLVESLRIGAATADTIAVVTFTEAAATELSTRIREGLEDALATTTAEHERERLGAAIRDLYRARIETLHAFASSILRERPVEACVDPQFVPLDDVAKSLLFDEVYDSWLDGLLNSEDAALERALRRGLDLELLRKTAGVLDDHRDVLPLAAINAPTPDPSAFRAAIAAEAAALTDVEPYCVEPEDGGFKQIPDLLKFADRVAAAEDDAELERLALFRPPRAKPGAGNQDNWAKADDCREMKRAVKALLAATATYADDLRTDALVGVLDHVQDFVASYAERRRTEGVVDFDDMLRLARDLLRDDLSVRRYFQERYRVVLIDEFQDTDPLQAEIALYLTSDGQRGKDWRKLRPVPGKLVVVGDPKQSIYRFRRADIGIYDDVKYGALDGQLEQISQNFRSVGEVLGFSNRVFEQLFGTGERGAQAAHVPLETWAPARLDERAAVVMLKGDGTAARADDIRAQEFDRIARVLWRAVMVDGWTVRDERTGDPRPATWGDVAILLPKRTGLEALQAALEAFDIPYRTNSPRGFFASAEVHDMSAVLRAIDDPSDALSLLGALRSRAFSCSDDDIVRFSAAGGRFDIRREPPEGTPAPVAEAIAVLGDLHRQRRGLSIAELVRRTLDTTAMVELALSRDDEGAQVAANLLKIVDQARAFSAAGGGGLRAFTRWLGQRVDGGGDESEAAVSEEGDPVVRIVTIHSAKGLEFPIVALANLSAGQNKNRDPVARPDVRALHFTVGNKGSGFATPGYDTKLGEEHTLLEHEQKRLLYVALTRARDHLVVPVVPVEKKRAGMLGWLCPHLPDGIEDEHGTDVDGVHVFDPALLDELQPAPAARPRKVSEKQVVAADAALDVWAAERKERLRAASREVPFVTASSVKPFDRVRPLALVSDAGEDPVGTAGAPPLQLGDALHRVMEAVALPGAEDLAEVVAAACREAGVQAFEAEVLEMAQACLGAPVLARALASDSWTREVSFMAPTGDDVGAGYAAGRMDLLFREGDELVIVDYKTDSVGSGDDAVLDAAVENHRTQAAIYAWAAERATGLPVAEVVFVFARVGVERSVVVDEGLRGAARGAVAGSHLRSD